MCAPAACIMFERLRQPVFAKRASSEVEEPASVAEPTAEGQPGGSDEAATGKVRGKIEFASAASAAKALRRRRVRRGGGGGGNERTLVGLDIGPGMVVAAKSHVNGKLEVDQAAWAPLGANIVRDGEVNDIEALADTLRELFKTSKLERRVRIGIANQRIMMRRIELPPLTDDGEIDQAVRFQAADEIPMPIASVVLDYRSLGIIDGADGPRLNVLLVAARRDMIERVLQACRLAGLQPQGIDLAAFGMVRALRPLDAGENEHILYLSIGGLTNLAISHGRMCEFTRVIQAGLDPILAEVASRCAIPISEARTLLNRVGADSSPAAAAEPLEVTVPLAPDPIVAFADPAPLVDSGFDESPAIPAEEPVAAEVPEFGRELPVAAPAPADEQVEIARSALSDGIRRIAAEVRNSLDFYLSPQGDEHATRGVICGPALDVPGFQFALSRELGIDLAHADVALASAEAAGNVPPNLIAVAAGLSVPEGPQ
jgi:type IV pilus assembly protein PilM